MLSRSLANNFQKICCKTVRNFSFFRKWEFSPKSQTLSFFIIPLTSCKISEKTNEPILRKMFHSRTDDAEFIGPSRSVGPKMFFKKYWENWPFWRKCLFWSNLGPFAWIWAKQFFSEKNLRKKISEKNLYPVQNTKF